MWKRLETGGIYIFTGIIEEVGKIENIQNGSESTIIKVKADKVLKGTKVGDSIATSGVCLTVTSIGEDFYTADIMNVSLKKTSLKNLKRNDLVNLERAMKLGDRLDGHIVQGHVDGVGKIVNIEKSPNNYKIEINTDREILQFIVSGGSVALDGISLTVSDLFENSFQVSIIPTTLKDTSLMLKKIGDFLNIETDILGKYINKFVNPKKKFEITEKFLRENNF
ncbi:MAG: riboflavin synthase [Clostridia bacterium]|nr:riboflavin synthase [Clostridia bacterium]